MRIKILILSSFLLGHATWMNSQAVTNQSYSVLLKSILSEKFPHISTQDLDQNLEGMVVLDAREREEYLVSKIPYSTWVGYDDFELSRVRHISKNAHIVVYCSIGYRSEKIAEKLIEAGFNNVKNLYGGIFEWVNDGYAVVDVRNEPTQYVHAYDRLWGIWLKKGKKVYEYNRN